MPYHPKITPRLLPFISGIYDLIDIRFNFSINPFKPSYDIPPCPLHSIRSIPFFQHHSRQSVHPNNSAQLRIPTFHFRGYLEAYQPLLTTVGLKGFRVRCYDLCLPLTAHNDLLLAKDLGALDSEAYRMHAGSHHI